MSNSDFAPDTDFMPVDGDPYALTPVRHIRDEAGRLAPGQAVMPPQRYPDYLSAEPGAFLPTDVGQVRRMGYQTGDVLSGAAQPFMAPGDYMQGKISPEEAQRQAINLGATVALSPGGLADEAATGAIGSGPVRFPKRGYVNERGIWTPEDLNRPMGSEALSTYPELGSTFRKYPQLEQDVPYLSPEEAATVSPQGAQTLAARLGYTEKLIGKGERAGQPLEALPPTEDYAMGSWGGRVKRGWYDSSGRFIQDLTDLGTPNNPGGAGDALRFSRSIAALSPQNAVETNALNQANFWAKWEAAGRPTDEASIRDLLGKSVVGKGTEESVLEAWAPNAVRAMQDYPTLSGPKVHSFGQNVYGDPVPITNDAWEAHFADIPGNAFAGSATPRQLGLGNPDFNPTYLANSIRARQASEMLTKMMPDRPAWTPMESQETRWTLSKGLKDATTGTGQTPLQILPTLTHDMLYSTPDFAKLYTDPTRPYADILRSVYPDMPKSMPQTSPFTTGVKGFGPLDPRGLISADSGPFAQAKFEDFLRRLATRLENPK